MAATAPGTTMLLKVGKERKTVPAISVLAFQKSHRKLLFASHLAAVGHVVTSSCREAGKGAPVFQASEEESTREHSAGKSCWFSQPLCLHESKVGKVLSGVEDKCVKVCSCEMLFTFERLQAVRTVGHAQAGRQWPEHTVPCGLKSPAVKSNRRLSRRGGEGSKLCF